MMKIEGERSFLAEKRAEATEKAYQEISTEFERKLRRMRFIGEKRIMERAKEKVAKLWIESPGQVLTEFVEKHKQSFPFFAVEEEGRGFTVLYGIGRRIFPDYFYDNHQNFYRAVHNRGYLGDAMWVTVEIDTNPPIERIISGVSEAVANNKEGNRLILPRGFYIFGYFILNPAEGKSADKVIRVIKAESLEEAAKELPSNIDTEREVIVSFAEKARDNRDLLETVTQKYDVQTGSLLPPIPYQTPKLL